MLPIFKSSSESRQLLGDKKSISKDCIDEISFVPD